MHSWRLKRQLKKLDNLTQKLSSQPCIEQKTVKSLDKINKVLLNLQVLVKIH